jgi:hypothetical protein
LYADDIQLYISSSPSLIDSAILQIERCIADVKTWLELSYLYLNEAKTEVILLGSATNIRRCGPVNITVGDQQVISQTSVRDLGVIVDSALKMDKHISNVCRQAFLQIRLISRQYRVMNSKIRLIAVQALVIPHIDFSLSVVAGAAKKNLQKIQRILRTSMRLVYGLSRRDSVTPQLMQHGWLPVTCRIQFRLLCIVYLVLHNRAPVYLSDLVTLYNPTRGLRSSNHPLLDVPRSSTKAGERAFSSLAPRLWNRLPTPIREATSYGRFRHDLKNHLMKDS